MTQRRNSLDDFVRALEGVYEQLNDASEEFQEWQNKLVEISTKYGFLNEQVNKLNIIVFEGERPLIIRMALMEQDNEKIHEHIDTNKNIAVIEHTAKLDLKTKLIMAFVTVVLSTIGVIIGHFWK